jgi:hypothetical protein
LRMYRGRTSSTLVHFILRAYIELRFP